jgi:hypothetical protein
MSYLLDDSVRLESTNQLNAFGRLRVSDTRLLGEYRYMYGSGTSIEVYDKLNGSGQLIKDQPRNCFIARVGTDSGAVAVRQTKQYHPYIAGTTNVGMMTFVMGAPKNGLTQSVGMFDDLNGFIFRVRDNTPELVIRKSGIDAEVVPQTEWNGVRMNGTRGRYNQSGVLVDWTKAQILAIDYQWLGVGKVRFSLVYGDETIVAHTFYHSNTTTEVYTNQPSLPCRWDIRNTTGTASTSDLMVICAAVYCEGSDSETGFSRSVSTGNNVVTLTTSNSSNGHGILAVKLKDVLESKPNHALARLKNFTILSNQDIRYRVVILPGQVSLNTVTWQDVPGYSWCQYASNFTLASTWETSNDFQVLHDDFAIGGQANKSGEMNNINVDIRSAAIYQNYTATDSMVLAIIGYRLGMDVSVRASLDWLEVK